ncbi:hypothetical protein SEA_JORDAN_68 [Arthrobacter phage Jordan]|nr:hypothetical protein SEA_JORDAN_68 [Arthrobacter phage Jordan]
MAPARMSKRQEWAATNHFEPAFGRPITGWWKTFAWKPLWTVDRGWVWLRVVRRRRIAKHDYLDGGPDFWDQYAVDI